ncbi:hypothetical protein VTL71DRAFT_6301 [Oculimacula yallundae]|uniref:Uncharacterized protein n=1 Tax=Oculimacula yallundae TaxID=86028 RepID=A0ABR4BWL2_9HELO
MLLACKEQDPHGAAKLKVLGLKSYGKALRMLPGHLGENSVSKILSNVVVLILLAYFECFLENPRGTFGHLWCVIQLMRGCEKRLTEYDNDIMAPVYDAILRLDMLAQKVIPDASTSFLRFSDQPMMERPFLYPLITICRVIWGCWSPASERPSRAELWGFCSEMQLCISNSSGILESCQDLQVLQSLDPKEVSGYPIPPPAFRFICNDAALSLATANCYLGCAVAMISATDPDPEAGELEAFNLVYQTLCIATRFIGKDNKSLLKPYKPCDTVNIARMNKDHQERLENNAYLGLLRARLIPLLMPVSQDKTVLAFYLRYGQTYFDNDENAIQVVAKASWKQDMQGPMQGVSLQVYDSAISDNMGLP